MTISRSLPIGLFDSGVGGLTVMKQIMHRLPDEEMIYFGDTARLPYGGKSGRTILRYSIENTMFLLEKKVKMLVVACNTAAAYSAEELRQSFSIPMVDVIEAGVEQAVRITSRGRIAVLGTKATIDSGIHQKEILARLPEAYVISIACPLLVPLVEENFLHHAAARLIVREYLTPLQGQGIDTLLLGCTHYPLLLPLIQEEVGPDVLLVDSAMSCAQMVVSLLQKLSLQAESLTPPQHTFYVSDDPDKFSKSAVQFLGRPAQALLSDTDIEEGQRPR